jgi:hypothetical protein
MVKQEVTFTVKGFIPPFKEVVETPTGTHDEVVDELNKLCSELFHDERSVVRDVLLVVQK